jgi:hypothetical protein
MTYIDCSVLKLIDVVAAALVSCDPIGAVRLALLAAELRARWRT